MSDYQRALFPLRNRKSLWLFWLLCSCLTPAVPAFASGSDTSSLISANELFSGGFKNEAPQPKPAVAPIRTAPQPLLQADHLSYDDNTKTIVATGHVEISQGGQILRADKITYNKETNVARATGHVALTQPSGEILYAKEIEVTSDLKDGFLERASILFPDNSRLASNDAQRYEGRYLVMDRGVYTACSLCASDPTKPPLWQMNGVRVTHDAETKEVIYRDATLSFDGVPVFFTPYFSHPDPTVVRRQGFLTPEAGVSSTIGTMAKIPYYFDLAPNSDLVVAPTFSAEDKVQMAGIWRHRFSNGSMYWDGSFTHADFVNEYGENKGYVWRGNLTGQAQFNVSDTWRAGTDVAFTSDKSYLPRYKITSDDLLVNRAYAERFVGRDYAVGNMYYFQDTRPGTYPTEPFVGPEIRYSALGEPNQTLGGRWSFDTGLLVTTRDKNVALSEQGPNTRRLSMDMGWERQLVSETGFLTTVSAQARADSYWADNVPDPNEPLGTGFDNVERTRPFAQGNLSIRYPLGRRGDGYQQILEPIAVLSVAPRQSADLRLPNEDSLDVEFDETNIFEPNHFTGVDRLEGGTRVAYGVRHSLVGDNGARLEMLAGQIFRTKADPMFPDGSGLENKLSDYVGRTAFTPADWFNIDYGVRLDRNDGHPTRQQISTSAGNSLFRPSLSYFYGREIDSSTGESQRIEEGSLGIRSNFTTYWFTSLSHSQSFKPDPGPRSSSFIVGYKDECFQADLEAQRDYTNRVDIESGLTVLFRFYLRNIGGWETSKITTSAF